MQTQKETRVFSKATGQIVRVAQTALADDKYDLAISLLKEALESKMLNAYETATIYQILGTSYYEQNQYKGVIDAFEAAMSSGGLLPNEASNLRVNIAQLLIGNGKPAEGAQMLEDWIEDEGRVPMKIEAMLWQAWSQAEQYDRALPWAEKWFEAANPKRRKHYDLLYFLYRELEMRGKSATIIKQMYTLWPDDKSIQDAHYVLNNKKRKLFCGLDIYCN
jgi:tetratricopeptide (TPR) repeat protein